MKTSTSQRDLTDRYFAEAMSKSIFITGASTGIGKATAEYFAAKGWHVIATMRDPEKGKELRSGNITVLPLDVTDPEQIRATAEKAISLAKIDVVFNNAGYGIAGAFEAFSDEQLTRIVNTNLLGGMRVTQAFIPYFRKNRSGMFITTTSIGGLVAFPFFSPYHATKWALEGWSESMSFELKRFGIRIKTVSPGSTDTDFAGRSLDKAMTPEYQEIFDQYLSRFLSPDVMKNLNTPEQIAQVVYEAATDDKDQLRYVAGADAQAVYKLRNEVGAEAFRQQMDEKFFG